MPVAKLTRTATTTCALIASKERRPSWLGWHATREILWTWPWLRELVRTTKKQFNAMSAINLPM